MSDRISEHTWLHERLRALAESGHTGEVRILFKRGIPKRLNVEQAEFPPPAVIDRTRCPLCAGPLEESDYGNRYGCRPCERVWTRAQMTTLCKIVEKET